MDAPLEKLPERIGPYRVLQLLGQGGMGLVYEAEETGPVRRRVAIKVVRAGLNSRQVIARFDTERQALAVMNHPGIAKVLQAGETETGEPYFTMELVRGLPITAYADTHRLSVPDRIQLFIEVCRAVQHAHQKGVIHRDLKPSNVLVTEQDGRPQPKIIDFGIAKATGRELTDEAAVTMAGVAVGTAAYMSPEQASAPATDIDTRADVYSLGVMLYELLIGGLPVDPAVMGPHAFLVSLTSGLINPPAPSARLGSTPADGTVTHCRQTDLPRLKRELRGDLDWIVLKAISLDRTRRYDSANGLADDLQRHLANQPVIARPPSARYRLAKFVRRHRVGVAAGAVVALAIVGGAVLSTVGFVTARRAERLAAQEAEAAQQVTTFLTELFRVNDPGLSRGDTLTARELLARGADSVERKLAGQPALQSRLMQTLGTVHQQLGMSDQARVLFRQAVQIREKAYGPNDTLVAESLNGLGDAARSKGDLALADSAYVRALAIREAAFGPESREVASTLASLAVLRTRQGKLAQAESLYHRVLPIDERLRPPSDQSLLRRRSGLANVYFAQGRLAEAESIFLQVLAVQRRALGEDHYDVGSTLNNLGGTYYQLKRYDDALRSYEAARPIFERSLGPAHPNVFGLYNNMGEVYWKLKQYDQAERLLRQSLAAKEKYLAPGHASIATTLHALAGTLRDEGRLGEAEPLYRRALEIREKTAGTNPRWIIETLHDYAELRRRAGRLAEAAKLDARAAQLQRAN
jgi:non-specific serine/threonine protein kinase/serine/threonine-protein kinase